MTIALFTYGTLMKGEPRHNWIAEAVQSVRPDAYIDGFDLRQPLGCDFPVIIPGTGPVRGQVLFINGSSNAWKRTRDMEINAGYILYNVAARAGEDVIEAWAFVYPPTNYPLIPVPRNDWTHRPPGEVTR